MRSRGWVAGGVLGAVAAVAVHRNRIGTLRSHAGELPDGFPVVRPPDRELTVVADDGVTLSVEELDPADGGNDGDLLIQFEHSEAIAALLTDVELVRLAGAGHVPILEQPQRVSAHLLGLLSRCVEAQPGSRVAHDAGV